MAVVAAVDDVSRARRRLERLRAPQKPLRSNKGVSGGGSRQGRRRAFCCPLTTPSRWFKCESDLRRLAIHIGSERREKRGGKERGKERGGRRKDEAGVLSFLVLFAIALAAAQQSPAHRRHQAVVQPREVHVRRQPVLQILLGSLALVRCDKGQHRLFVQRHGGRAGRGKTCACVCMYVCMCVCVYVRVCVCVCTVKRG